MYPNDGSQGGVGTAQSGAWMYPGQGGDAQSVIDVLEQAINCGDLGKARRVFERAVRMHPDHKTVRTLGATLVRLETGTRPCVFGPAFEEREDPAEDLASKMIRHVLSLDDPYEILGLDKAQLRREAPPGKESSITADMLRNARNRLARSLHPDKNSGPQATKAMQKMQGAHDELMKRHRFFVQCAHEPPPPPPGMPSPGVQQPPPPPPAPRPPATPPTPSQRAAEDARRQRDAACASASVAGSYASASASATSGPDLAAAFAQAYASMTGGTAFAQAYTVASDPEWMEHKPDPSGYPGAFSPYCRACRKWATSDHLRTPRHERMVAWRVHY